MFLTRTINRHITLDMTVAVAEGAALFTFIFLLKRIYELTDLLVAGGSTMGMTFNLISSILPSIMILTIPMAILLAALMVYGRMAHENEIIALYAGRYSSFQLLVPALIVGILLTALMIWWCHRIGPKGLRYSRTLVVKVLEEAATAGIRPGNFNQLGDMIVLPNSIEDGQLRSVRLFEKKDEEVSGVISASTGAIKYTPATNALNLNLEHGVLHQIPAPDRDVMIHFEIMNFSIKVPRLIRSVADMGRDAHRLSDGELNKFIVNDYQQVADQIKAIPEDQRSKFDRDKLNWYTKIFYQYRVELAQRRALPFACLIMSILGALLGMKSQYGKRSANYATTIAVIFVYYILLSLGKTLVENGNFPAWPGLWIPNAVCAVWAAYLYYRTLRV